MTRILIYIVCGALLAISCNMGIPISEPLPAKKNWAGIEVHYHEQWDKCFDTSHSQVTCPMDLKTEIESPELYNTHQFENELNLLTGDHF